MTKLELKEKFWSWSGDDYQVKDPTGKAYVKVNGKVMNIRDKMVLLDPDTGAKICFIQQHFLGNSMNDKRSFQIFTYTPKDVGQESTEQEDGVPVYKYGVVHEKAWAVGNNFGDQYNLYLYLNNEQTEPPLFVAFRETWRWSWDSKVNVFKGDQVMKTDGKLDQCEMVSKFGMFDKTWWENTDGNNRYGIEMTKNVDPVLQVCLAVICDAMQDK